MSGDAPAHRLLVVCEPIDASAPVVSLARHLAAQLPADITLLGLTEEDALSPGAVALLGDRARSRLAHETAEALERFAGDITPEPRRVVRHGRGFMQILGEAVHGNHTLVLKPAADRPGLHARLLGSTDQHLLRKCPVPLWLERSTGGSNGILVALDVDHERAPEAATLNALNDRILDLAAAVTDALGETLHIAHAWDAPEEALLKRWPHDDDEVETYLRSTEAQHRSRLDRAAAQLAGRSGTSTRILRHLRRGDPRDVLPRLAQELDVRLVVMGTIARTGIPGLLIGNTAEDVLNDLRTALLTVKPPGFVCPVATPER